MAGEWKRKFNLEGIFEFCRNTVGGFEIGFDLFYDPYRLLLRWSIE